MKSIIIFLIISVFALVFLQSCTKSPSITPKEIETQVREGSAILVDVREEEEVKLGMAEPAQWMPLSKMKDGDPMWDKFLNELPKDKLVVFYCVSGRRSGIAADKTKTKGFNVANMGGFKDWVKAGLPTRTNAIQSNP